MLEAHIVEFSYVSRTLFFALCWGRLHLCTFLKTKSLNWWQNCLFVCFFFVLFVLLFCLCLFAKLWGQIRCCTFLQKGLNRWQLGQKTITRSITLLKMAQLLQIAQNIYQRSRKREDWIFCTQICVKGAHKAGDKSPLSSSTRNFELKICFEKYVFLSTQRRKMGLFFVVEVTITNAKHDWYCEGLICIDDMIWVFSLHREI